MKTEGKLVAQTAGSVSRGGTWAPLATPLFRRVWLASLLSNLGLMIQAVGAAWNMTQMTNAPEKVALVQTALMLPVMLVAIPAGAIADMFDRRKVAIAALCLSLASAISFSALSLAGLITPWLLLAYCFMVGSGSALLSPAWQSSVSEQVPATALPQAVALNSISYNIARSFGPAIGGIIVAAAGAIAAFLSNALLYLPLLTVMSLWRRVQVPARFPPERLGWAIRSGIRYVFHSPSIRTVLGRSFVTGFAGGSISSLMPLVARNLIGGGAQVYGILLGSFGVGAVLGGLAINQINQRFSNETAVRGTTLLLGAAVAVVSVSSSLLISAPALVLAGAMWMASVTIFNIGVQLSAPRWVSGRTLATFQASICGGIALGSWCWGHIAAGSGVRTSLLISAVALGATALIGYVFRMPETETGGKETTELDDPEIALAITGRSGPILVEIQYRVDADQARAFYGAMQELQRIRQRNGAYDWEMSRDLADEETWVERYHCPTWHDYLRQRSRMTATDIVAYDHATSFHKGERPLRIRRLAPAAVRLGALA